MSNPLLKNKVLLNHFFLIISKIVKLSTAFSLFGDPIKNFSPFDSTAPQKTSDRVSENCCFFKNVFPFLRETRRFRDSSTRCEMRPLILSVKQLSARSIFLHINTLF